MITTEKDKAKIRKKISDEVGYLSRSNIRFMEIDFKKLGMTYMNYQDAVKISLDLIPEGWSLKWNENKKGVVVLKKP